MDFNLPFLAGTISTIMFGGSMLPMVLKAVRTRDLHSYSLGNILLANGGNLVHSFYVFSLPPGPIWALHTFHFVTTALMLIWYLLYEPLPEFANNSIWRRFRSAAAAGDENVDASASAAP